MASTIGKVRAVFTASTSGLTAGVNSAAASMRRMEASVASLRGPLNSLVAIQGAQLFGSIASTVSQYAQSLAGLVGSTTEAVSAQNDLAARLGLTYAELSGLTLAGSMVGVSMDQIGGAMTRAQVAFSNAAAGSRTATAAFERIGLSVADLNGLSAEQQFDAIAQAISQLPTEAERAAAAVRIFGRAGAELLPLFAQFAPNFSAARAEAERLGVSLSGLRTPEAFEALSGFGFDAGAIQSGKVSFDQIAQAIAIIPGEAERAAAAVAIFGAAGAELVPLFAAGASEIQAAREEAERFGLSLTNAQAGNIDTMGDSFDRARAAIQGVINQVVAYLAPAVTSVTTAFSDLIGNVGGANIGQAIGEGILQGARYFAEVADAFVAQATPVWNYVSQVGGQWSAVWDAASRVGSALAAVGRFIQGAFLTLVGVFSGIGQAILTAVRAAADALGFDTQGLDTALAALDGFNSQLNRDIASSFNAAGENLNAAFGEAGSTAGEAIAGPFTQTIDQAIAAAREAADGIDVAATQTVEVQQTIDATPIRQAIQGIESNSAEGIREMFRIMRGDTGDQVQERIARGIERVADNTEDLGDRDDPEVAELAPAAGG